MLGSKVILERSSEAIYAEYFHRLNLGEHPSLQLRGPGAENRSLMITRGRGDVRIPSGAKTAEDAEIVSPMSFEWTAADKKKYKASVKVTNKGIEFEGTGESLPQNWFFYASQTAVPARESADRFTALRKAKGVRDFVRVFTQIFDWIDDVFVDSVAGIPVLSAIDKAQGVPLPLTAVSGGINRIAAILLAIAHQPKGIVMVDEIENGVFYTKHVPFAKAMIRFAREHDCQLFLSSHSQEWLRAFIEAAGKDVTDISLWRIERTEAGPAIQRFAGKTFKAGIEHGTDVRG